MSLTQQIIDARGDEAPSESILIALVSELIRIPSLTNHEKDLAKYIASLLNELGWDDVSLGEDGNLVARVAGSSPGPKVMFLIHSDTQQPNGNGDQYSPSIVSGSKYGKQGPVVRGLGANSPKSAIASMILATDRLFARKDSFRGEVLLAIVIRDLLANNDGIRIAHQAGFDADFVIAGEPSSNRVVTAARGIAHYDVTFTGKKSHAGTPDQAINPIRDAAEFVRGLRALAMSQDDRLGSATINELSIEGKGDFPQTPEKCLVRVDFRPLPEDSSSEMQQQLQEMCNEICERSGGHSTVELVRSMFPFGVPEDDQVVTLALETLEKITGEKTEPTIIRFASNAGYALHEMSARGICIGPGDIRDSGPSAHVLVEDLVVGARFYETFVADLTKAAVEQWSR